MFAVNVTHVGWLDIFSFLANANWMITMLHNRLHKPMGDIILLFSVWYIK